MNYYYVLLTVMCRSENETNPRKLKKYAIRFNNRKEFSNEYGNGYDNVYTLIDQTLPYGWYVDDISEHHEFITEEEYLKSVNHIVFDPN